MKVSVPVPVLESVLEFASDSTGLEVLSAMSSSGAGVDEDDGVSSSEGASETCATDADAVSAVRVSAAASVAVSVEGSSLVGVAVVETASALRGELSSGRVAGAEVSGGVVVALSTSTSLGGVALPVTGVSSRVSGGADEDTSNVAVREGRMIVSVSFGESV
jgi:hypothetical protein